jgi:hypothetical protein
MIPPTPETALCSAYQEQADCYGRAAELAESLAAWIRDGEEYLPHLDRVLALLREAADIEERIRPLMEHWVRGGGRPGEQLRSILIETAHRIERLARSLAEAEQAAAGRHAQLVPQMDTMIRGRAMRRAYSR